MIRKLTADGDIVTSGEMWAKNEEAIAINVRTALQMFLGENFRNINEGTPWFQDILGAEGRSSIISAQLKRRILGVVGVQDITFFKADYDREKSTLNLQIEILTDSGQFVKIGEVVI